MLGTADAKIGVSASGPVPEGGFASEKFGFLNCLQLGNPDVAGSGFVFLTGFESVSAFGLVYRFGYLNSQDVMFAGNLPGYIGRIC